MAMWTGAISFGMVTFPVKVETAVRSHDLGFRLLYLPPGSKEFCPVGYEKVCKHSGKEIPKDEIVKGYEYEKDRFVVLDDEDFDRAALATTKTFEVEDFVAENEIDPRFFEKPYYLIAQKGGEKAYALLRDAMRNTGTIGIGRITLRKKQYLAAIKPVGDALVMDLMRFADEVLDASEFRFPEGGYNVKELKMAEQVIEMLTEPFDPGKYEDQYKANLEQIIQAKMKGKKVNLKEAPEPEMTGVIDLMDRLQQSLKQGKKKGAGGKASAPKKKRKTA